MRNPWIEAALDGVVIINIGQLDKATLGSLEKMVRDGALAKDKRHWDTLSKNYGLGLKTVYGLPKALNPCPECGGQGEIDAGAQKESRENPWPTFRPHACPACSGSGIES